MKKVTQLLIIVLILSIFTNAATAQKTPKDIKKQRNEQRAKIKGKAVKEARKEGKRLEKKEGWSVFPGALPISKQLEDSWMKKYEMKVNDDGSQTNAYVYATGSGVAKTKSAAKMKATDDARVQLAQQMNSYVTALTTSNIANAQLSTIDAETIDEVVQTAKTVTVANLKNVQPVFVIYRTKIPKSELRKSSGGQLKPGNVEVSVELFYDLYQLNDEVKETIKKELKTKLENNEEELNKLMKM